MALLVIVLGGVGACTESLPVLQPEKDGSSPTPLSPEAVLAGLVLKTASCMQVSDGKYKLDATSSSPETVPVCSVPGAFFWKADMDVDCDGKTSAQCSIKTDASFQPNTATVDSKGKPLDAAILPYVVVPQPGKRFDYKKSGLKLGSVVAVIYNNKIEYGILGDTGPVDIIGEASYAMAKSLGINPNPSSGGIGSGVTYVAFTAASAVVTTNEDHAEAVRLGRAAAMSLLQNK